jgi:hypothetical protein
MPVDSEIRARVEAFAADLIDLIKASALDVVHAALGQPQEGRRRSSFGGAAGSSLSAREKGAKRDPQVLDALVERLSAFVIKNPGKRIEEIGSELAIATKELALPVKKLIAAKRITTKGQRRATTYYPAAGRSTVRASEKPPKSSGRQAKTAKKARKAGAKSKAKTKAGPARANSKSPGRPRSKGAAGRSAAGSRAPKSTSGDAVASARGKAGGGSAKPPADAEPSEQSSENASED